ncbi:hypothetical protein HF882_05885 [Victivallis vadensis]|uniref:Lipoprotein n=1 Tax=Victivallis vadensis TaxID=172901 RepID=A0A2U1AJX3_9BACT|nr:hypothetical protein [Victivallis vadensis]NMD86111.1 hypothetical protein [Victivallis vadensis]PVY36712.1 hypothetical protein C8D82_13338 [Victivallis vadensis]
MKKINRMLWGLGSAGVIASIMMSGCKSKEEHTGDVVKYTELETTIVNQPLTKFNDIDFIELYEATSEKANLMLNEKR